MKSRLVQVDEEAEPGLEGVVGVVDVVAVVAVAFFHAEARERLQSGVAQAERRAGFDQTVVDVRGLLGRNVELVAELAHIGDADAQRARKADVDLARGAERECLVGEVGAGQRLQQLARARALHVDLAISRGHVGDDRLRVAGNVAPHPGLGMAVHGVGHDDENASSSSLVTVRSASSVPLSLSHCV